MVNKLNYFKKLVSSFRVRVDAFFKERFTKYIIDYKLEGDNLRIITNFGDSRLVKNTPENQAKLNKIVIKSKLDILLKIDEYENKSHERACVLIMNIMLLGISGLLVPFTFFTGSYIIFALSIILFSFLSLSVSVITIDYYVLVEEIRNLKNVTGYKISHEFNFPSIKNLLTK